MGDWVDVDFEGNVEGFAAKVRKRMVVTGMWYDADTHNNHIPQYWYRVAEHWPKQFVPMGIYKDFWEGRLIAIEPLTNELLKANNP